MGLIFLRHAYSRYLAVKPDSEAGLPRRGGVTRPLTKEDFTSRGAIFLQGYGRFRLHVGRSRRDAWFLQNGQSEDMHPIRSAWQAEA